MICILTIYKITCLVNKKVYIGQTSETIEKRFARHMGYQKDEHDIEEIKEKIRQSKLGDKNPMRIYGGLHGNRNGMYGKTGKLNPFAKKCMAISLDGTDIQYFDTLTELKESFGVTTLGMVTMRCRGKTKAPIKVIILDIVKKTKKVKRLSKG